MTVSEETLADVAGIEVMNDGVEEAQEIVEATEAPQEEGDYTNEELARAQGWTPKDEFMGKESNWKDADTFLAQNEDNAKIAISQNKRLTEKVAEMHKMMEAMKATNDMRIQAEVEGRVKALEQKRREAFELGQWDEFTEVEKQIKEVVKQPEPVPTLDPVYTDFVSATPWFNRDSVVTNAAVALEAELKHQYPDTSTRLAEVKKRTEAIFSERLGIKPRQQPVTGAAPRRVAKPRSTNGFDTLPADAQAAGKAMVAEGTFKDTAEFATYYNKSMKG